MNLDRCPDFGPTLIRVESTGVVMENSQRERNAIRYLLQILDVKQRGEFICGEDNGPGMDTLEGAAFRVAKLVERLRNKR